MRTRTGIVPAVVLLSGFVLPAAAGAADPEPRLDQFGAVANVQLRSAEGLQRLELPLPVLQASRSAGYGDVRLFDAAGEPVPMAWALHAPAPEGSTRSTAAARFAWPEPRATAPAGDSQTRVEVNAAGAVVRIESSRRTPGAKPAPAPPPTTWLLDLSALAAGPERVTRLVLDWPAPPGGLVTGVQVEGSDDTRSWNTVTRSSLLDLAQGDAPAVKHVDWPAGVRTPRYLRLRFDVPLALNRSDVVLTRAPPEPPRQSAMFAFAADPAAGSGMRAWVLDLQGRVPLSHITVQPAQPNTVLLLRLEQRDDVKEPWHTVTSFSAWRLTRDGREGRSTATAFHAPAARHWRLVADARSGGAGEATLDAQLEWTAPQLVFVARGAGAEPGAAGLRLAVGRERSSLPALSLASLIPGYREGGEHLLPQAQLANLVPQQVRVPGLPERVREAGPADWRRWGLWAVLCAAVLVLGGLAWRLLKDVDASRGGPPPR